MTAHRCEAELATPAIAMQRAQRLAGTAPARSHLLGGKSWPASHRKTPPISVRHSASRAIRGVEGACSVHHKKGRTASAGIRGQRRQWRWRVRQVCVSVKRGICMRPERPINSSIAQPGGGMDWLAGHACVCLWQGRNWCTHTLPSSCHHLCLDRSWAVKVPQPTSVGFRSVVLCLKLQHAPRTLVT